MTELDKISNRPDHRLNWIAEVGIDQIQLDGTFTKEQLLELAYAMGGHSWLTGPEPYSISYSVDPTQFEPYEK